MEKVQLEAIVRDVFETASKKVEMGGYNIDALVKYTLKDLGAYNDLQTLEQVNDAILDVMECELANYKNGMRVYNEIIGNLSNDIIKHGATNKNINEMKSFAETLGYCYFYVQLINEVLKTHDII